MELFIIVHMCTNSLHLCACMQTYRCDISTFHLPLLPCIPGKNAPGEQNVDSIPFKDKIYVQSNTTGEKRTFAPEPERINAFLG